MQQATAFEAILFEHVQSVRLYVLVRLSEKRTLNTRRQRAALLKDLPRASRSPHKLAERPRLKDLLRVEPT
jgi:hypothetical protein